MTTKPKPIVGQTLFSINVGNASRNKPATLTPVIVQKVGRKYFTVNHPDYPPHMGTEHHLDTWRQHTQYCADAYLYASEQEYKDEKDRERIVKEIRRLFEYGGATNRLSLDQLRQIWAMFP